MAVDTDNPNLFGSPPPLIAKRPGERWRKTTRARLRSRDGCLCHWCGEKMNFPERGEQRFADPLFATIEHVVELRNGGTNDDSNLVLAHYKCNHFRPSPAPIREAV